MIKKQYNWGLISEKRRSLMGIAIISIVLFHYFEDLTRMQLTITPMTKLFRYGNIGVDMFLYISGIGLYYSYNRDNNRRNFYKKRFKKIMIPYFIISTPFWVWKDIVVEKSFKGFFMDISLISFFTEGNRQLWFIALISILYIGFPYIYDILYKNIANDNITLYRVIILNGAVIVATVIVYIISPSLYNNIEIALTRIPVFIIGCYHGKKIYNKRYINIKLLILSYAIIILSKLFIISNLQGVFMQLATRYIGTYIAIVACSTISIILSLLRFNVVNKIFEFFGLFTLELYMVHVLVRTFLNYYDLNYLILGVNIFKSGFNKYVVIILISLILSILVNRINRKYVNKIVNKIF